MRNFSGLLQVRNGTYTHDIWFEKKKYPEMCWLKYNLTPF